MSTKFGNATEGEKRLQSSAMPRLTTAMSCSVAISFLVSLAMSGNQAAYAISVENASLPGATKPTEETNLSTSDESVRKKSKAETKKEDENEEFDTTKKASRLPSSPTVRKRISDLCPSQPIPLYAEELEGLTLCSSDKDHSSKREAPGPEHGGDPHDEIHDDDLPARASRNEGFASQDPYGGTTTNDKWHPNTPY